GDVLPAIPQRWNLDPDDVENLTETRREAGGVRSHARERSYRRVGAAARIQGDGQALLNRRIDRIHVLEEEAPTAGETQPTAVAVIAEQDSRRGLHIEGRAVHGDERLLAAAPRGVDVACRRLSAGATLTAEHHRRLGSGRGFRRRAQRRRGRAD